MSEVPNVAPFESCIGCFRGDTTTLLGLEGEAEFLMAALGKMGVHAKDARKIVLDCAKELGCDPGMVPSGDMEIAVRVCPLCAAKGGMIPGSLDKMPVYAQPEEWRGQ